jgi:hypothetical protein
VGVFCGALAVLVLALACSSEPPPPPDPTTLVGPDAFSGRRAWVHLEKLSSIGQRQTGTRGAARARRYLASQLEEIGAVVEEVEVPVPSGTAVHVVGVLPGASSDRFVLTAAYDTRAIPGIEFVGANASASGAAVVIELARALSERPRPYTLALVFLDGEALPAESAGVDFPGSRALAARWAASPEAGFERIRLAVFFQQVGDIDLSIGRDLRSHHVYREFFWDAAAVLGKGAYFPSDARGESIDGSHVEFIERGLPRSVLISDPRFGGSDVPGRHSGTAGDTPKRCSPDSLEVVGEVSLEALDRIAERLERIDRFRESPLQDPLGRPSGGGME